MSEVFGYLKRRRSWLLLALTLLFVVIVRVRLREMQLERDEGEYAYAGQLILQGVPPYKEAYNMKLPGTYAAYAVIEALLGQTVAGIHLGVMVVNLASIVLIFLLGRKLLDEITGLVSAVCFALLSLSPSVLGLAGHATHFVALFALAGIVVLLHALELPMPQSSAGPASSIPHSGLRTPHWLRSTLHAPRSTLFAAGLLLGLAFLMKQHGIFFCIFGVLFLLWRRAEQYLEAKLLQRDPYGIEKQHRPRPWWRRTRKARAYAQRKAVQAKAPRLTAIAKNLTSPAVASAPGQENAPSQPNAAPLREQPTPAGPQIENQKSKIKNFSLRPVTPAPKVHIPQMKWGTAALDLVLLATGIALPYLLTCLMLWRAGVFHQFIFWTISYASKYASNVSFTEGEALFRLVVQVVIGPELPFWLLAGAGALMFWWDPRVKPSGRFFLTALALCSIASASVGFYFREHYFILVLPILALLGGAAVSRAVRLLKGYASIEVPLAVPVLLLGAASIGTSVIGHSDVWFSSSPKKVVEDIYGTTLFSEAANVADYIRTNSTPDTRIAVIGSEPEIYFYAHRRSATGYLYTYPIVENQLYSRQMQREMTGEIERAQPEFVVYVGSRLSWMPRPHADLSIYDWFRDYWAANLDLQKSMPVDGVTEREANAASAGTRTPNAISAILLLKRKPHEL